MPMITYDLASLKKMVRDEKIAVQKSCSYKWVRVQRWWIAVHEKRTSLWITFECPNTAPGGIKPSITTRTIAL